jgi:transposase-like protein
MAPLCYRRHRIPPEIIQHAIWLYLRFTLSYRDVEELLAERGLDISYEMVQRWVLKFGPAIARRLRRCRPRPSNRRHLDEMVVRIAGRQMCSNPSPSSGESTTVPQPTRSQNITVSCRRSAASARLPGRVS